MMFAGGRSGHPRRGMRWRLLAPLVGSKHRAPFFWKQYGLRPLPASGMQEDDIGHNTQWGAPEQVAADIVAFVREGRPLPGLPRSDAPEQIGRVLVDGARTVIEAGP